MAPLSQSERTKQRLHAHPSKPQNAAMQTAHPHPALVGLTVFERGWLSSNNVLLHAAPDEPGAVLVDSAHVLHAQQTVALVGQALNGQRLHEVVNTHLHSDHCGGNATLQRAFGCSLRIPPGGWTAALHWDEDALSYRATGQRCERFVPTAQLAPGEDLVCGGRRWQVLAAPGHDPDSVILFDPAQGVLISADALWENGFGVVFPELEGEDAFDDVGRVLDLIETLDARLVIPGHGAVFTDVPGALQRARRRLAGFQADPARHRWHAVKVLLKYHLLEELQQPLPEMLHWLQNAPLMHSTAARMDPAQGDLATLGQRALDELVAVGALALREGVVYNV
jgi:glyoxylase-like metal-dependent hydrolase (beta-lactamase superfamily II)